MYYLARMAVVFGTRAAETRSTNHTRRAKADVTAPGQRFLLLRMITMREVERHLGQTTRKEQK